MIDLNCPYCGSEIMPTMVYRGGYGEDKFEGYECQSYKCSAEWDTTGTATRESDLSDPK